MTKNGSNYHGVWYWMVLFCSPMLLIYCCCCSCDQWWEVFNVITFQWHVFCQRTTFAQPGRGTRTEASSVLASSFSAVLPGTGSTRIRYGGRSRHDHLHTAYCILLTAYCLLDIMSIYLVLLCTVLEYYSTTSRSTLSRVLSAWRICNDAVKCASLSRLHVCMMYHQKKGFTLKNTAVAEILFQLMLLPQFIMIRFDQHCFVFRCPTKSSFSTEELHSCARQATSWTMILLISSKTFL